MAPDMDMNDVLRVRQFCFLKIFALNMREYDCCELETWVIYGLIICLFLWPEQSGDNCLSADRITMCRMGQQIALLFFAVMDHS